MHISQPSLCLLACILESLVIAFTVELCQLCVQRRLLAEKRISPNVGLQDRVQSECIVSHNLRTTVNFRPHSGTISTYLLLNEQYGDM